MILDPSYNGYSFYACSETVIELDMHKQISTKPDFLVSVLDFVHTGDYHNLLVVTGSDRKRAGF